MLAWTMAMRPPALPARRRRLPGRGRPAPTCVAVRSARSPALAPLGYITVAGLAVGGDRPARPAGRPQAGHRVARRDAAAGRRRGRVRDADHAQPGAAGHPGHLRLPHGDRRRAGRRPADRRVLPQAAAGAAGAARRDAASSSARWSARSPAPCSARTSTASAAERRRCVGLVTATARGAGRPGGRLRRGRAADGRRPAPTMWVARHMQGPLGGFALAAPAAYVMTVLFLDLTRRGK